MHQQGNLIRYAEHTEMLWANGGGTTREIARQHDEEQPYWRLSLATVDKSGPFSILPGCERIILLLEGQSMKLHFDDGEMLHLNRDELRQFSCERPLLAVLSDTLPCRDLNLIWKLDVLDASAQVVKVGGVLAVEPAASYKTIVFVTKSEADVRMNDGESRKLAAGDTLVLDERTPDAPIKLLFQAVEAELVLFSLYKRS